MGGLPRDSKMHFSKFLQIFGGLVLGCIKTKFCKKYAFDNIFQALQDLHPFAPLQCQNFRKKSVWKIAHFAIFLNIFANFGKFYYFFWKKCAFRCVQRSALCRSRRELSNAYLLIKFGFDTAENEPCKVPRSSPRTSTGRCASSSGTTLARWGGRWIWRIGAT